MPQAESSIVIRARSFRVRRWLLYAPHCVPQWWPQVVSVERMTGKRPLRYTYAYDMLGIRLRGAFSTTSAPDALLIRSLQGPEIRVRIALMDHGDATSVAMRIDYILPGALLGPHLNQMRAERLNSEILQSALQNLKHILERPPSTSAT